MSQIKIGQNRKRGNLALLKPALQRQANELEFSPDSTIPEL